MLAIALGGCASVAKAIDPLAAPKPQGQSDKQADKQADKDADKPAEPNLGLGTIREQVRAAQIERLAGRNDAAIQILSQVVLIAPDDPTVLAEYGKALVAKGQPKDALAFLKRAIQLQPNDWSLYSAQGVAYDQFNDYADAQLSFARALALKPGDPTVLNNSAMSHLQVGDIAGAESLLAQAAPAAVSQTKIAANIQLVQGLRDSHVTPDLSAMARANIAAAPMPLAANVPPSFAKPVAGTPPPSPATVTMAPIADSTPAAAAKPEAKAVAKSAPAPVIVKPAPAPTVTKSVARIIPAVAESSASLSESSTIFVQAGAFGSAESAGKVAQDLSRLGARVSPMVMNGHAIFRVRIGPFHDAKEADAMVADIQASGHADVKIVRE